MRSLLVLLLGLSACMSAPPLDPRSQLSRAALDQVGAPLLLAEIPELRVAATLGLHAVRDGRQAWMTADAVSLTFQDGLIVGTRGLGADLMSADVEDSLTALRSGGTTGLYPRFHSALDGENRTIFRSYQCRIAQVSLQRITVLGRTHDTLRHEEICTTPDTTQTNLYWRGRDGVTWKARQWVGPGVGYLTTERLVR